ncbi:MAG: Phthiocerol/phenolphthiocerol synthesis polyketide synthase type PpsE [Planctomycetota bacterium]
MEQDIAVIGMAARLPDAPTIGEFWRNLVTGKESVRAFGDEELSARGVAAKTLRDPRYVKSGVVLDGFDEFDAEFFGFSPQEAAIMDPQHRVFLECAWEAIEDAGHPPANFGGQIGVFAGCGMGSYFAFQVLRNRRLLDEVGLFLLRHTGNDKDFLSTRVSYCFDLKGPSVNVQTACSTSLVGIHMACQSLLSGETDMALAGGVTIEMPHGHGYLYQEGEILSPDGHCRAFDHRSRGTIFGSGAGVVVLRRLADALADGDRIYAVVTSTAINNDGAGKVGYLAPSVDGQAAAVATAHALAGVDAADVGYVECHGTGTEIGDPIEVSALQQAFAGVSKRQYCGLGSVKTNIGHLDTAAGVASFIKVCLALHHEQLPPTLNYEAPNPLIDFANSPFFVNDRLRPWPRGARARVAGVNSLGVGGTNAHALVAEAPPAPPAPTVGDEAATLVWSARNVRSLDEYARRLAAHLRDRPELSLAEVASNLAHARHAFGRRRVLVARNREEAIQLLEGGEPRRLATHTAGEGAKVVFLLPGGGAQYRGMGRGLYASDAVFREHVDRGLELLRGALDVDLREVWLGTTMSDAVAEAAFDRPSVQLPAIFLVEYALAQSWRARGVEPTALLGHSLGENAAACLAGVFSFADALRLVTLRGQLFERVQGGGMVSVPLSADACRELLTPELDLATVNAPELCVVSGPDAALDEFAARLAARDIEVQRVKIKVAAHSRLLEPILAEFGAFLRGLRLSAPKVPFVSNRTGTWITDAQATDPEYWVGHLRNTVRFAEGVELLLADSRNVFVEVGPGRTLSSLVRLHPLWNGDRSAIASLRHPEEALDDALFWRHAEARLWAAGGPVAIDRLVPPPARRISLPHYAFRRQRYWVDADPVGAPAPSDDLTERLDDLTRWQWVPEWSKVEAPELPADAEPGTWLVLVDEAGVGSRLSARLRARGADVVEVRLGDSFARLAEDRYSLAPESGREGYDALLRELAAAGRRLRGVAHCWLLTADRSARPGSSFFHRCEEQGFYSLLFLAQALGAEELHERCRITVFANDLFGLPGRGVGEPAPEKALVLGPMSCMPRELADLQCAVVDLELPIGRRGKLAKADLDAVAVVAERELAARDSGRFAWRGGARLRRGHVARELAVAGGALPARLRERGTYLLTGGLGGIGSLVADWLARTCRARLILLGRRAVPPRDRWDAHLAAADGSDPVAQAIVLARRLETAGAEVHLAVADVADVVQVRAALGDARAKFGAVHGWFHAAGVVADELMAQKEQAAIERVFAPKVHGALALEEALGAEPLDFAVLFSSTSAELGPPGQVDYVAANAFLDALARRRSAAGKPTLALQWGAWNRVGMTAAIDAGRDAAHTRPEPVEQPLLRERVRLGADEWELRGKLDPAAQWLLDEHRTAAGDAVVPGTGYLSLAAQSLAAIGERGPFVVGDLYFFRPLYVADGQRRDFRVRLRRAVDGYEFVVESSLVAARGTGSGSVRWVPHAQARLSLGKLVAPSRVDLAAVVARCDDLRQPSGVDWLPSPQEANLRFGPRWRVVRELRYGVGEALARLSLAEPFAPECAAWPLHPALLDLATGFAMELVPGYEPSRLWVPLTYRRFVVHRDLPHEVFAWTRSCRAVGSGGDLVALDLLLTDAAGEVVVEVEGFQMKRLAAGQRLASGDEAVGLETDQRSVGGSGAEQALAENIAKGIRPAEGVEVLGRLLSGSLPVETTITPVPLPGLFVELERAQRPVASGGARFTRPELDVEYVAPRDEVEQGLVRLWEELLGIDAIGVHDDFFALGGHSLIAVRLFAKIKKTFRVDYPMSVLFEAPTIERLAQNLKRDGVGGAVAAGDAAPSAAPATRYRHLVAMHPSRHGAGTPFFLVAGMFGNVLNLRHLAQLAGADRPFYGLQARGLFGDMQPHATFEEAARDYLEEVRAVQPHGPYLLGGFSGGGLTAYEMARQLREAGEEVAMLVLLDTPLPIPEVADRRDRIKIQWQRLQRDGVGYFWRWAKNRAAWEWGKLRRKFGGEAPAEASNAFHSQAIEAAFRSALVAYDLKPLPLDVWLFRPPLPKVYDLGGGRYANKDRELVYPDNRWTPYVKQLTVVEVPGDHDSMVLEPNVRSLAAALRTMLDQATR